MHPLFESGERMACWGRGWKLGGLQCRELNGAEWRRAARVRLLVDEALNQRRRRHTVTSLVRLLHVGDLVWVSEGGGLGNYGTCCCSNFLAIVWIHCCEWCAARSWCRSR